jgi:hypothetical protein
MDEKRRESEGRVAPLKRASLAVIREALAPYPASPSSASLASECTHSARFESRDVLDFVPRIHRVRSYASSAITPVFEEPAHRIEAPISEGFRATHAARTRTSTPDVGVAISPLEIFAETKKGRFIP